MHFYFRPSFLLYVYSLGQAHHSSCSRRAGLFTKGCDKVVTARIRRRENLIGMSTKFDRCWHESLSNTARGSTDLFIDGRIHNLNPPFFTHWSLLNICYKSACIYKTDFMAQDDIQKVIDRYKASTIRPLLLR